MNTHELAWAAGFYDGEGSTSFLVSKEGARRIKICVGQKDRRALDRFHTAVGVGKIALRTHSGHVDGYKLKTRQLFHFETGKFEDIQHIVASLWPWLGEVKRAQAKSALQRYLNHPMRSNNVN